jgi:hypothetical protein
MLADSIVSVINREMKSIGGFPLSPDRFFTFSPELYKLYETEAPDIEPYELLVKGNLPHEAR